MLGFIISVCFQIFKQFKLFYRFRGLTVKHIASVKFQGIVFIFLSTKTSQNSALK